MIQISVFAQEDYPYVDEFGFIVKPGQQAPDFTIVYAYGDHSVNLFDLRGDVVLLQFTASWCSVCRTEMPHLENRIWKVFKGKNFHLIGIDRKESVEKVKAFARTMNITYPLHLIRWIRFILYMHTQKRGLQEMC